MTSEIDQKLEETLQEVEEVLPLIIHKLHIEIGRFPTEDEVKNFFWAEDDEHRMRIIREARKNA